jgi:acyl-CoA synthetase (AMP-forming)/AMP-acid ligase II
MYGQWIAGATLFVYDHEKFHAADILEKVGQYRITSFCAPPTIYRFMIREDLSRFDLSSLEHVTTAGEALNSAVFDKFKEIAEEAFDEWFLPDEESSAYYSGIGDCIRTSLEEYFKPDSFEIYFREEKGE